MTECPSAAHGTPADPYGCYEREQRQARRDEAAFDAAFGAGARAERHRLVQRVIAGDLIELSSEDRRRVIRWLEGGAP